MNGLIVSTIMLIRLKQWGVVFLFLGFHLHALDEEDIRALAKKEPDRKNMMEELTIYPMASEYEVTIFTGLPGQEREVSDGIIAKEKVVDGRYIISESTPPHMKQPMIMVVTYDKKMECYRKWILFEIKEIGVQVFEMIGVGDMKARSVAWTNKSDENGSPASHVVLEHHTDTQTSWRGINMVNGKVVSIEEGVAVKVK